MYIREMRKAKHLTMKELGNMVGVSESAISMYENGKRQPDFETLLKIAEALGTDADTLLRGKKEQDTELNEYLEELKTRPEMRMLFSVTKGATKEDVEKAVRIIEAALGK